MALEGSEPAAPPAPPQAAGAQAQAPAGPAEAEQEQQEELSVTVDLAPGAARLVVLRQARRRGGNTSSMRLGSPAGACFNIRAQGLIVALRAQVKAGEEFSWSMKAQVVLEEV